MPKLDLIGWAERFIATPSISRDGNLQIAELAAELAVEAGLAPKLERTELDGVPQLTLRADLGPQGEGGLLMLTHLDTVPPGDPRAWTETDGDPFRPTRSLDRLYGLGSADAKVDLVCKLAAVAEIDGSRLTRPLRVVGTYGEEIGLVGARDFVSQGGASGMRYALVGEPSELVAIRAHKGLALYRAEIELEPLAGAGSPARAVRETLRGVSAHSSTPHLGESAIEAALERIASGAALGVYSLAGGDATNKVADSCNLDLAPTEGENGVGTGAAYTPPADAVPLDPAPLVAFLREWRLLREELRSRRDSDFDPDHTVCNLGLVRTQGRSVCFHFDLRPIPGIDLDRALRRLAGRVRLRAVRESPPLMTSLDSPLIAAVTAAQQEVGLPVRVFTKPTCTEAGLLSRAGLDAVVIGAGLSIGNVHRPNEHTRIPELALARDLYRHVIESLCVRGAACSS